jgi:hypothetical protein
MTNFFTKDKKVRPITKHKTHVSSLQKTTAHLKVPNTKRNTFISKKQITQVLTSRNYSTPPNSIGNMKLIDWGGHRYVYDLGNGYVVKITVPQDIYNGKPNNLHNQTEYETYRDAPPLLKQHLAPVVAHAPDYTWIVMKKARTTKTGELSDIDENMAMLEIRDTFRGAHNYVTYDLEPRQCGRIGEHPVIIDYGFGVSY